MSTDFDYIICGAGIASLYAAFSIVGKYPTSNILIIHDGLGGKINTHNVAIPTNNPTESTALEMGASAFTRSHIKLNKLITDLGMKHLVISSNIKPRVYIHMSDGKDKDGYYSILPKIHPEFDVGMEVRCILRAITQLCIAPDILLDKSMYKIIKYVVYPFIYTGYPKQFNKLSRHIQNAIAIRMEKLIRSHGNEADIMSASAWSSLIILQKYASYPSKNLHIPPDRGGMSQIIIELVHRLKLSNVVIRKLHVTHINLQDKIIKSRELQSRSFHDLISFRAKKDIVIGLPADNIQQIISRNQFFDKSGYRVNNILFSEISAYPICVIYLKLGNYSTQPESIANLIITKDIMVNNPISHLTLVKSNIYKIHCDTKTAKSWGKLINEGEDIVRSKVQQYLNEIGFKCTVEWTWSKYWPRGGYYWKPKSDPLTTSETIIKKLNIIGSSFAIDQSCIEGALRTVDRYMSLR